MNSSSIYSSFTIAELAWPEAEALAYWFWSHLSLANLRKTFYLVTPWESTFEEVVDVPDYTIEVSAWWAFFLLLEFLVLCLSGHSKRFALDDSITSITAGLLSELIKSSGRTISLFAYTWIWENLRLFDLASQLPTAAVWAICLISQDLAYYLGHRAMHEISLFWSFHSVHHSSHYFNISTAFRQPLLQDIGLAPYELLQAFFIPPPLFLVHRYFSHIYQFWLHTSLLGSLGPLGLFLNTPAFHRVHHGRNAYCIDRNFGALLIIWDRLFGTFQAENPEEPPQFGLANGEKEEGEQSSPIHDQFKLQLIPLKKAIFDKLTQPNDGLGMVSIWKRLFWPPNWHPRMKTHKFFHWRSLSRPRANVLDGDKQMFSRPFFGHRRAKLPTSIQAYLLIHFLLLICMFLHFHYNRSQMEWNEFGLKFMFFLYSIASFGGHLDRKELANIVEIVRCLCFCLYQIHQNSIGPFQFPSIFLTTFFALSATFLTFRQLAFPGKCATTFRIHMVR